MASMLVHLNGTSKDGLLAERMDACRALRAAVQALRGMAPNGRDYYLLAPGSFERAAREHRRRVDALAGVLAEVEAEMRAIDRA